VVGWLLAAARLDATIPPARDSVRVLADIGFVSDSGNSDLTTLSFGQQLVIGTPAWLITQDLSIVYSRSDGLTSADQLQTNGRAEHHLGDRLGVYATIRPTSWILRSAPHWFSSGGRSTRRRASRPRRRWRRSSTRSPTARSFSSGSSGSRTFATPPTIALTARAR
jgi:hypothetical protein